MSLSAIRASVGPDRDSRWSVHDGQFFAEHTLRTNPRAPVERRLVNDAEDQQRLSRQRRAELALEAAMLPQSADGGGANDDAVKNLEREVDAAKLLRSMWLVSARGRFPEHDGGPHRTEAPRLESAQPARRRGRRGFFPEPPGPPKAPSQILPATVTRALQTGDFAPMRQWLALSGYAENAPRCTDSSPHPTQTPLPPQSHRRDRLSVGAPDRAHHRVRLRRCSDREGVPRSRRLRPLHAAPRVHAAHVRVDGGIGARGALTPEIGPATALHLSWHGAVVVSPAYTCRRFVCYSRAARTPTRPILAASPP